MSRPQLGPVRESDLGDCVGFAVYAARRSTKPTGRVSCAERMIGDAAIEIMTLECARQAITDEIARLETLRLERTS